MHDQRALDERRIDRELHDRLLPLVHPSRVPLMVEAGPSLTELTDFEVGSRWGTPWGTTWFRLSGHVPEAWATERVEAIIDLGFHPDAAGFQCEGLVINPDGTPRQGIHPRRMALAVDSGPGPVVIDLEAASNPQFAQFRPSPLGAPEAAARTETLYRFARAELVVVDAAAEALAHDLDVLDGVMRSLDTADPRRIRLRTQIIAALDLLPDIDAARRSLAVAYRQPARTTAHRIAAIGHAHIDTAWLWPLRETVRKCTRTFASAVALLDEYPEYRFACSQAQHYAWIEEQHPELFSEIVRHLREGRWIPVGGMWVESDMNLPSGESLVRQIVHGQRYFEDRFGVRCTEVWIPDVFGYPAGLPQVFAAGGMHRFVTQKLSWNKQNRFPHHTFHWEGLDGTRVLTHFPPVDTYNAEITPEQCAYASANFSDHAWSDWSLMPFGHGDGGGGPTREMLERARRLGDLDGAPRLEIATPAQFFDHVEAEILAGATAPVWRGELYFETHRGTLTSQRATKAANQRCEHLLWEVELWAATAGVSVDLDAAWKAVLTQQFHDILPGSSINWVHRDAVEILEGVASDLETMRAGLLADLVGTGEHPVLINPAAVSRDEIIITEIGPNGTGTIPTGPTQRIGDAVAWRATAPAMSTTPAVAGEVTDRVVVTETSMLNGSLAVRFDHTGTPVSIIDLEHQRELLNDAAAGPQLELAVDHPVEYDAWDLESWTIESGVAITDTTSLEVIAAGPLVGQLRVVRAFGPSSATITYTLRAHSPRLDIDIEVDWHHDEHLLSVRVPLDVHSTSGTCDVQFGLVERPRHRSDSWDAARFEVCAHRFVDVSEPSFGVAVLNDGPYGHGLDEHGVRISLLRAAKYPDPDADHGQHRFSIALLPHGPGLAGVVAEAERFVRPARLIGAGETGDRALVHLRGAGVLIDAVKSADDDSGDVIVRLHEHLGDRTTINLATHRPVSAASTCSLLEEPQRGLEVSDGIVAMTLRPFELVTLRLSLD